MGIARRLAESDSTQAFPFVFQITTTSANTVFTCPITDYGGLTPQLNINWGDSSASPLITSSSSVDRIHTYVSAGTYTVTISGFMPGFSVNNNVAIRTLITELVQWGIVGLRTINFYGCQNLISIPGSGTLGAVGGYTGLSEVVNFNSFFQATRLANIPADIFDYSPNATTFSNSFASILTLTGVPTGLFDSVPSATTFTFTARVGGAVANSAITATTFTRSDAFIQHRPFDGGVKFTTGSSAPGSKIIRQTRRYFRYQSGKGIQFSTGSMMKPVFAVDLVSWSHRSMMRNARSCASLVL